MTVLESDLNANTKRLEEIHVAHKKSLVQIVEQTKQACEAAYQQVRSDQHLDTTHGLCLLLLLVEICTHFGIIQSIIVPLACCRVFLLFSNHFISRQ